MILLLGRSVESKSKCKTEKEAKQGCKVMTLDYKTETTDKMRSRRGAVAFGLTFRRYFILKPNLVLIFCFNA
jgi:hypothetical protein